MNYIHYNSEQYLFDRCLHGIFIAIKLLFRGIIYCPLLITGYFIACNILDKKDHAIAWIGLIVLSAYILYLFIFFLKGMLIAFKSRGNWLWILLFIACISYTCIAPAWLLFETIQKCMFHLSKEQGKTLTWLFSFAMSAYIYSKYQFLMNVAPIFAAPVYQAGINFVLFLIK